MLHNYILIYNYITQPNLCCLIYLENHLNTVFHYRPLPKKNTHPVALFKRSARWRWLRLRPVKSILLPVKIKCGNLSNKIRKFERCFIPSYQPFLQNHTSLTSLASSRAAAAAPWDSPARRLRAAAAAQRRCWAPPSRDFCDALMSPWSVVSSFQIHHDSRCIYIYKILNTIWFDDYSNFCGTSSSNQSSLPI